MKRSLSPLRAWWGAWKYVALLGAALVASISVNALQWRAKGAAIAKAEAATMKEALKITAGITREAQGHHRQLLVDLSVIAKRQEKERIVYRTVAAKAPLPANCAPGRDRMAAVNQGADR